MNIEKKNLEALEKWYPALKNAVDKAEAGTELSVSGASMRIEGALIHSERDPVREASRLAQIALKDAAKKGGIFILGFGLGYAAEAVLELDREAVLVIVEKRLNVFKTALKTRDISALFNGGRHIFVIGGQAEGILAALEAVREVRAILRNRALILLDSGWFDTVLRLIHTWREKNTINAATLARFGKLWTRNSTKNLSALRDIAGIAPLAGAFNFPLLLIAAGPSLDELTPFMPALRQRCLIVAVGTAMRFLRACHADPDFLVTSDPQYWNLRHLDPLAANHGDVCLIAEASVQSAALRICPRTLLFSSLYPPASIIEAAVDKKGALGAGGSVATSAFDFTLLLRRNNEMPVFVGGLDLAFPSLKTHYRGALFEEMILSAQNRLKPAQKEYFNAFHSAAPFLTNSISGGMVYSDRRLSLYARWFENRLGLIPEAPVFSLGGGGIAIRGIRAVDINEVLKLPDVRAGIDARKKEVFNAIEKEWNLNAASRAEKFSRAISANMNSI